MLRPSQFLIHSLPLSLPHSLPLSLPLSLLPFLLPLGRGVKVNLCGHSIAVDRSSKNRCDILIFGGKETLEVECSNPKRISLNSHFTRLDTISGLISAVGTNSLLPSNRFVRFLLFLLFFCYFC